MRRAVTVIAAALLVAVFSGVAQAENPHFAAASAAVDNSGNLIITFREAGLGDLYPGQIWVQASASEQVVWGCVNKGGNHPQASNKTEVDGPFTTPPQPVSISKNGSAMGKITINPLPAPSTLSCPGGQKLTLVSVSYSDVSIKDITNNLTEEIQGTFSVVFYH